MRNITLDGVTVYCDRYVIDRRSGEIYFLSIYGQTQAVNSILGGVGSFYNIDLQIRGVAIPKLGVEHRVNPRDYIEVARRGGNNSNIKSRPVSWGRAHGVYVDSMCRLQEAAGDFIVIGQSMEDVEDKIYAVLDFKPIPLTQEWKKYLIDVMTCEGYIQPLETYGCEAAKVNYEEEEIIGFLSSGIKSGVISVSSKNEQKSDDTLLMAA